MLGFKGDFHEGPPIVIHQWSKPGGSLAPRSPLAWTLLCILARNFLSCDGIITRAWNPATNPSGYYNEHYNIMFHYNDYGLLYWFVVVYNGL